MKKLLLIILSVFNLTAYAQQIIELCPNTNTTFTYNSDAGVDGIYTWTVGDYTYVGNTFTYTWTTQGEYMINLSFISEFGCIDNTSYNISVVPCNYTYVYVPNSFTPNGDGLNDTFDIVGYNYKDSKMYIFNRWGDLIFQSDGSWNGTYRNNPCQQDVYVYLITWYDGQNKFNRSTGRVTLLK